MKLLWNLLLTGFCLLAVSSAGAQIIPNNYYQLFDYEKENKILHYGYVMTYISPFASIKPDNFASATSESLKPASFEAYYFLQLGQKENNTKFPLGIDITLMREKNSFLVSPNTSKDYNLISESKGLKLGVVALKYFAIRGMLSDASFLVEAPIAGTGEENKTRLSVNMRRLPGLEIGLTSGNNYNGHFIKGVSSIFDIYGNWSFKINRSGNPNAHYEFDKIQAGLNYKVMIRLKKQTKLLLLLGTRYQREFFFTNQRSYDKFVNPDHTTFRLLASDPFEYAFSVAQVISFAGIGLSF